MTRFAAAAFGAVALATFATTTVSRSQPADHEIQVVLPRDAIPAIDDPEFVGIEQADPTLAAEELMIGIVGEDEQRAYSTWQLDRHEIVNDMFEGRPIAVTW